MVRIVKKDVYWVLDFPGLTLTNLAEYENEMRSMARFHGYEWKEEGHILTDEAFPPCRDLISKFEQAYRSIVESVGCPFEQSKETEDIRILADYRNRAKTFYFDAVAKYGITHVPNPFFFGTNLALPISEALAKERIEALKAGVPTMEDEVLDLLLKEVEGKKRILEIGTAVGISASAMIERTGAELITVEKSEESYKKANALFAKLGMTVESHHADAMEFIQGLSGSFDFILLDGPKVQYIKYLPYLKKLLSVGGTLFADDVLLFGWVNGKNEVPKKRQSLVRHIKEYLEALEQDECFQTKLYEIGEGVAVSRKLW